MMLNAISPRAMDLARMFAKFLLGSFPAFVGIPLVILERAMGANSSSSLSQRDRGPLLHGRHTSPSGRINAGFMKRLKGKCKLIPVILDGVEVPEVLRSTV